MKIYEILDEFHHQFEDEEEYDKMWRVFGAPQETVQRIEKQQGFLDKEKEKFIKQMEMNKQDFTSQIMELENLTSGFKQYQDGDAFEEVANMAKNIHTRIEEALAYAKKINHKESLVDYEECTDYTSVNQMQKDFKPFYDLWTTVETWKKSHESWLNDPFEEVDSNQVEETVDNSNKVMAQVLRFFRDKDLPKILKIAEGVKDAVQEFTPQVPIVIALRTDGMKDRHWDKLSEAIGVKLSPTEGFTF